MAPQRQIPPCEDGAAALPTRTLVLQRGLHRDAEFTQSGHYSQVSELIKHHLKHGSLSLPASLPQYPRLQTFSPLKMHVQSKSPLKNINLLHLSSEQGKMASAGVRGEHSRFESSSPTWSCVSETVETVACHMRYNPHTERTESPPSSALYISICLESG